MENRITHCVIHKAEVSLKALMLLLLVSLSTSPDIFAQGKFVEGFIITNENDTIRGLVKDEDWIRSPERIVFKIENQPPQTYSATGLAGFGFTSPAKIYKSKKIGLVDITLSQIYINAPTLDTKDSAQLFLQEIVTGEKASLFEFLNKAEQPHYFIETNKVLRELFNYSFHKSINDRAYLLKYDTYKNQLSELYGDSIPPKITIPPYQKKYLKQYIERYNQLRLGNTIAIDQQDASFTYDLDLNAGVENWGRDHFVVHNSFTCGVGVRVNFPRKFRNRYFKIGFFLTPNVLNTDQNSGGKTSLKTFEVAVGNHFGSGKLRPYIAFHYSGAYRQIRSDFLGFQAGISFNRKLSIDIGHFGNFLTGLDGTFFTPPRISIHYTVGLKRRV